MHAIKTATCFRNLGALPGIADEPSLIEGYSRRNMLDDDRRSAVVGGYFRKPPVVIAELLMREAQPLYHDGNLLIWRVIRITDLFRDDFHLSGEAVCTAYAADGNLAREPARSNIEQRRRPQYANVGGEGGVGSSLEHRRAT